MTLIYKAATDEAERGKWRVQANKAAAHLKKLQDWGEQKVFTPAFVFDDGIVKLPIDVALIKLLDEKALADWIFDTVLQSHAVAPQVPGSCASTGQGEATNGSAPLQGGAFEPVVQPSATPAAATAPVPCTRRLEPDFTQHCPNKAAVGLKITLRPAETVEKRWGTRSLLGFVMDLPVCADCLPKVQIMEITDQDLRSTLNKVAQQQNNGILVDWNRTVIERVPFYDPHYVALRREMEKAAAANDSQPGPAAPTT